jgi:hypothetical protein
MVFGPYTNAAAATGSRVYIPVAGDPFVRLAELNFGSDKGSGLFGNKRQLLEEWQRRLGIPIEEEL